MSFIKKLFGIKETEPLQSNSEVEKPEISIKVEDLSQETTEIESTKEIKKQNYDISEIKKQSTQIKNKEGNLSAINFIKKFIASNQIEFKELISLLKKMIPYIKKEEKDSEILDYINIQIEKFPENNTIENINLIADIISRVNNTFGLNFLEDKLGKFESDNEKNITYFDSLILLSDFYLADKKGDKAFQTIQRAINLVTNLNDKFDYLWKQKIIAEKSANICINGQKKPQYTDYLHYEIVAFILEIARDINGFPHLSGFFHRKNICFNDDWGFSENENFKHALENLNLTQHKAAILNEINNFTFIELPLIMGIPKEYLNIDVLKPLSNLSSDFENNYPEWRKVSEVAEKFKEKPFNEIGDINDFVSNLVKKYYDEANKKDN